MLIQIRYHIERESSIINKIWLTSLLIWKLSEKNISLRQWDVIVKSIDE